MGLSAGGIYLSGTGIALHAAVQLGFITEDSVQLDESHLRTGFDLDEAIRVLDTPSWSCILLSPEALLPHLENISTMLSELSENRKLFFWFTTSSSGAVLFECHEDGVMTRQWIEAEGQIMVDAGTALPEEHGLIDVENHEGGAFHDGSTVLRLVERLTGITPGAHHEMTGHVYISER
jgi:hypothetical protein